MSNLNFNNAALDNYLNLLTKLSKQAKLYIIDKLQSSLEIKPDKQGQDSLYGTWKSEKSGNQIFEEIRNSRTFKNRSNSF